MPALCGAQVKQCLIMARVQTIYVAASKIVYCRRRSFFWLSNYIVTVKKYVLFSTNVGSIIKIQMYHCISIMVSLSYTSVSCVKDCFFFLLQLESVRFRMTLLVADVLKHSQSHTNIHTSIILYGNTCTLAEHNLVNEFGCSSRILFSLYNVSNCKYFFLFKAQIVYFTVHL